VVQCASPIAPNKGARLLRVNRVAPGRSRCQLRIQKQTSRYSSGHRINRERLPADAVLDPARLLQRHAPMAAHGAAGASSKPVRRFVRSPSDDQRRHRWLRPQMKMGKQPAPLPQVIPLLHERSTAAGFDVITCSRLILRRSGAECAGVAIYIFFSHSSVEENSTTSCLTCFIATRVRIEEIEAEGR